MIRNRLKLNKFHQKLIKEEFDLRIAKTVNGLTS